MSRRKRANGADAIYNQHLTGNSFNRNTVTERTSVIKNMYTRVLTELATNRFKWTGLPDTVDVRYLEMCLFYQALSVYYEDENFGQLALKGAGTNFLNMIDNPTAFMVVGNNFVSKTVSAKDCVPIWANYMRIPDLDIVNIYAHRLAELDRTIEINSDNARMNKVIVSSENQRLSTTNINRQISEGQNAINVAGPLQDMQFLQAVDLGINPDHIEKLHIVRTREWNECMGLLGIENANQDKKERLVSSEVDANNDQTSSMRYVNLNARRIAAKQISEKYNIDVKVAYYTDVERQAAMTFEDSLDDNDTDEIDLEGDK